MAVHVDLIFMYCVKNMDKRFQAHFMFDCLSGQASKRTPLIENSQDLLLSQSRAIVMSVLVFKNYICEKF